MEVVPKLILDEGEEWAFDFNDGSNTKLRAGFSIPMAKPTESGVSKRNRGEALGMNDYGKIAIPIVFLLIGSAADDMLVVQNRLLAVLSRPRHVLTWNPDPDTCSDVYFDTYCSPADIPLDPTTDFWEISLDLLCDPHPYGAETTVFDTVHVLGQVDGEFNEWTGATSFSKDTTRFLQGTLSARTEITTDAASWLQRDFGTTHDLSDFITAPAALPRNHVNNGSLDESFIGLNISGNTIPTDFVTNLSYGKYHGNNLPTAVDTGTNKIHRGGHTFINGDVVRLTFAGTAPAPLVTANDSSVRDFYIVGSEVDYFKVSYTLGGAEIDFTAQGTGNFDVYSRPQHVISQDGTWTKIQLLKGTAGDRVGIKQVGLPLVASDVISSRFEVKCDAATGGASYTVDVNEVGGAGSVPYTGWDARTSAATEVEVKSENHTVSGSTTSVDWAAYIELTADGTATLWVREAMIVEAAALPTTGGVTNFYEGQPLSATEVPGWVTVALWFDSAPGTSIYGVTVRIGKNSSEYRRWDFNSSYGNSSFTAGWQYLFFDLNAPDALIGDSSMTAVDYMKVTVHPYYLFDGPAFNVDNIHLVNGEACNVRGLAPLPVTVRGIEGVYDCGFKIEAHAGTDGGAQKLVTADNGETIGEYTKVGGDSAYPYDVLEFYDYWGVTEGDYCIHGVFGVGKVSTTPFGFTRTPTVSLDLATVGPAGLISFDMGAFMRYAGVTKIPHAEIRIGNNSSNYVYKNAIAINYATMTTYEVLATDMTQVGTMNWNNPITYIQVTIDESTGGNFDYAYFFIDNMSVHSVAVNIDELTISNGSGVDGLPGVYGGTGTNLPGVYGGSYKQNGVFSCTLPANLFDGDYHVFARMKSESGNIRISGSDCNSPETHYSDYVTPSGAATWHIVDLGSVSIPFDGWARDADLDNCYSTITINGGGAAIDVNWIAVVSVARGARRCTPTSGYRYWIFDTQYRDSPIYTQGTSSNPDTHSAARKHSIGDLKTLGVGTNNLIIQAGDSSEVDECPSIGIAKWTYVPRYKNARE